MSRVTAATETVKRSIPRQDGGWMVVTTKNNAGASPVEIPEGARVVIREGQAERAK